MVVRGCRLVRQTAQRTTRSLVRQLVSRPTTENVDFSQMPVAMIIDSSESRAAGFTLCEVFPPKLEAAARHRSTRDAGIRELEGMGPKCFMLSVDGDTEFRTRCE